VKPIRGGLLAVVGVFGLLATAAPSWAAFAGANGLIAYSEPRGVLPGPNDEIFTISPAGGEPTRLTDNSISDLWPSWSADGRRLVFLRGSAYRGQNQNVWTMRADGTHQRQVTRGSIPDSSPAFSPGGGRIVMVHGWDVQGNIVIVRTDGSDPVRLTRDREARYPAFSPDGRWIAFSGRPRKERPLGIWVMRRDGTHKRLLANQAHDVASDSVNYEHPDFNPDGSQVVFQRLECISHSCDTTNVVMRSDGRRKRVIEGGDAPVFSPNGNRIAAVLVDCDAINEICDDTLISFDRHGGHRRAVRDPDDPSDSIGGPSWQPMPAP
jgi:Tol biopolymer transport system component